MSIQYNGYKHVFLDVETTGLHPQQHDIFQICAIVTDPQYNTLEKIDLKFRPFSLDDVSEEALTKTGMTLEGLAELPLSAREAYARFVEFLSRHCDRYNKADKMHFVGYNVRFDSDFMREFFTKNGDQYFGSWFWHPQICVMGMMTWLTQRVRGALPNFKLSTLCQCAEIEWDESKAHDAEYDIKKTMELFMYAKEFMPSL
jgi:DNA polymerase III alpha subunit (gram-positive type)